MTEMLPFNTDPRPLKLRIEDYLLLDGSGAFEAYQKTELIEGEVFFMNAQHRPHAWTKIELYDAFRDGLRAIESPLRAMVEASIALSGHSAPEPDIVLTDDPLGPGLVPVASVALIVEVSDTTLRKDRWRKAPIYAAAGIPEYWIADITERMIEHMWAPVDGRYTKKKSRPFGDCRSACKKDPLSGVIGVQKGPLISMV